MLILGILWFDNKVRPLEDKVLDAAKNYAKLRATYPDTCHVNPKDYPHIDKPVEFVYSDDFVIKVIPDRSIMPNHLWIGIDNA